MDTQKDLSHLHTVFVASDHAGWLLKKHLKASLPQLPWQDLGSFSETEKVDYPDMADRLCTFMDKAKPHAVGLLICGTGQGMAIRANRYPFSRAALCWNEEMAYLARSHNDANILCLGGRTTEFHLCEKIVMTFLKTPFEGGRHQPRVDKLMRPNLVSAASSLKS